MGKYLIVAGIALVLLGLVFASGVGDRWFGKLPGDIHYTNPKGNFSFHFPIITCIVVSIVISLLLRFFRK
jgi:hypothetical protein